MAVGPIFYDHNPELGCIGRKIILRCDNQPDILLTSFEVERMIDTLKALETLGEYIAFRAAKKEKT